MFNVIYMIYGSEAGFDECRVSAIVCHIKKDSYSPCNYSYYFLHGFTKLRNRVEKGSSLATFVILSSVYFRAPLTNEVNPISPSYIPQINMNSPS